MDILKAVERLNEIRELRKHLDEEERAIRESLRKVLEAVGGRLIAGSYVLSLVPAETCQYGKVVEALRKAHPELSDELKQLTERFKTTYQRITIERLS